MFTGRPKEEQILGSDVAKTAKELPSLPEFFEMREMKCEMSKDQRQQFGDNNRPSVMIDVSLTELSENIQQLKLIVLYLVRMYCLIQRKVQEEDHSNDEEMIQEEMETDVKKGNTWLESEWWICNRALYMEEFLKFPTPGDASSRVFVSPKLIREYLSFTIEEVFQEELDISIDLQEMQQKRVEIKMFIYQEICNLILRKCPEQEISSYANALILSADEIYKNASHDTLACFTKVESLNSTKGICGYQFAKGDICWNCQTCETDHTCVLCDDCFRNSDHAGHVVSFHHASPGGCCDCGDVEAWKLEGCCPTHRANNDLDGEGDDPRDSIASESLAWSSYIVCKSILNLILNTSLKTLLGYNYLPFTEEFSRRYFNSNHEILSELTRRARREFPDPYTVARAQCKSLADPPHTLLNDNKDPLSPSLRDRQYLFRLHNDDFHTYDEVRDALELNGHSRAKAQSETEKVDKEGHSVVKEGKFPDLFESYINLKEQSTLHISMASLEQGKAEDRLLVLLSWLTRNCKDHVGIQRIVTILFEEEFLTDIDVTKRKFSTSTWKNASTSQSDSSSQTDSRLEEGRKNVFLGEIEEAIKPDNTLKILPLLIDRVEMENNILIRQINNEYFSFEAYGNHEGSKHIKQIRMNLQTVKEEQQKAWEELVDSCPLNDELAFSIILDNVGNIDYQGMSKLGVLLICDLFLMKLPIKHLHELYYCLSTDTRFRYLFGTELTVYYGLLHTCYIGGLGTSDNSIFDFTVQLYTVNSLVKKLTIDKYKEKLSEWRTTILIGMNCLSSDPESTCLLIKNMNLNNSCPDFFRYKTLTLFLTDPTFIDKLFMNVSERTEISDNADFNEQNEWQILDEQEMNNVMSRTMEMEDVQEDKNNNVNVDSDGKFWYYSGNTTYNYKQISSRIEHDLLSTLITCFYYTLRISGWGHSYSLQPKLGTMASAQLSSLTLVLSDNIHHSFQHRRYTSILMNIIYVLRTERVESSTIHYTYLLQLLAMYTPQIDEQFLQLLAMHNPQINRQSRPSEYLLWRKNWTSEDCPPVNKFIGLQNWLKLQHRITGAICEAKLLPRDGHIEYEDQHWNATLCILQFCMQTASVDRKLFMNSFPFSSDSASDGQCYSFLTPVMNNALKCEDKRLYFPDQNHHYLTAKYSFEIVLQDLEQALLIHTPVMGSRYYSRNWEYIKECYETISRNGYHIYDWFQIITPIKWDSLEKVSYINPLIHNFTRIITKCAEVGIHHWYEDFVLEHDFQSTGVCNADELYEFNGFGPQTLFFDTAVSGGRKKLASELKNYTIDGDCLDLVGLLRYIVQNNDTLSAKTKSINATVAKINSWLLSVQLIWVSLKSICFSLEVDLKCWTRNGVGVLGQSLYYRSSNDGPSWEMMDLSTLQVASVLLGPTRIWFLIRSIFGKFNILVNGNDTGEYDYKQCHWKFSMDDQSGEESDKGVAYLNEMFKLIIQIVQELPRPKYDYLETSSDLEENGIKKYSFKNSIVEHQSSILRRKIIHKLACKPLPRSGLSNMVDDMEGTVSHRILDSVLEDVATRKVPSISSGNSTATYEIQPDILLDEYDPTFPEISKSEHHEVMKLIVWKRNQRNSNDMDSNKEDTATKNKTTNWPCVSKPDPCAPSFAVVRLLLYQVDILDVMYGILCQSLESVCDPSSNMITEADRILNKLSSCLPEVIHLLTLQLHYYEECLQVEEHELQKEDAWETAKQAGTKAEYIEKNVEQFFIRLCEEREAKVNFLNDSTSSSKDDIRLSLPDVESMKVKELKAELDSYGISYIGIVEKKELRTLLDTERKKREHMKSQKSDEQQKEYDGFSDKAKVSEPLKNTHSILSKLLQISYLDKSSSEFLVAPFYESGLQWCVSKLKKMCHAYLTPDIYKLYFEDAQNLKEEAKVQKKKKNKERKKEEKKKKAQEAALNRMKAQQAKFAAITMKDNVIEEDNENEVNDLDLIKEEEEKDLQRSSSIRDFAPDENGFPLSHEEFLQEERHERYPNCTSDEDRCVICQETDDSNSKMAYLGILNRSTLNFHLLNQTTRYQGISGYYRITNSQQRKCSVRIGRSVNSSLICWLPEGTDVYVQAIHGRRALISAPVKGWLTMYTRANTPILESMTRKYGFQRWGRSQMVYSFCGHAVHMDCWKPYETELRRRTWMISAHSNFVNPALNEFLCPLCKSFCNVLVPKHRHDPIQEMSENYYLKNASSNLGPLRFTYYMEGLKDYSPPYTQIAEEDRHLLHSNVKLNLYTDVNYYDTINLESGINALNFTVDQNTETLEAWLTSSSVQTFSEMESSNPKLINGMGSNANDLSISTLGAELSLLLAFDDFINPFKRYAACIERIQDVLTHHTANISATGSKFFNPLTVDNIGSLDGHRNGHDSNHETFREMLSNTFQESVTFELQVSEDLNVQEILNSAKKFREDKSVSIPTHLQTLSLLNIGLSRARCSGKEEEDFTASPISKSIQSSLTLKDYVAQATHTRYDTKQEMMVPFSYLRSLHMLWSSLGHTLVSNELNSRLLDETNNRDDVQETKGEESLNSNLFYLRNVMRSIRALYIFSYSKNPNACIEEQLRFMDELRKDLIEPALRLIRGESVRLKHRDLMSLNTALIDHPTIPSHLYNKENSECSTNDNGPSFLGESPLKALRLSSPHSSPDASGEKKKKTTILKNVNLVSSIPPTDLSEKKPSFAQNLKKRLHSSLEERNNGKDSNDGDYVQASESFLEELKWKEYSAALESISLSHFMGHNIKINTKIKDLYKESLKRIDQKVDRYSILNPKKGKCSQFWKVLNRPFLSMEMSTIGVAFVSMMQTRKAIANMTSVLAIGKLAQIFLELPTFLPNILTRKAGYSSKDLDPSQSKFGKESRSNESAINIGNKFIPVQNNAAINPLFTVQFPISNDHTQYIINTLRINRIGVVCYNESEVNLIDDEIKQYGNIVWTTEAIDLLLGLFSTKVDSQNSDSSHALIASIVLDHWLPFLRVLIMLNQTMCALPDNIDTSSLEPKKLLNILSLPTLFNVEFVKPVLPMIERWVHQYDEFYKSNQYFVQIANARHVGVDNVNIHASKADDISTNERIDITTLATHDIHLNMKQKESFVDMTVEDCQEYEYGLIHDQDVDEDKKQNIKYNLDGKYHSTPYGMTINGTYFSPSSNSLSSSSFATSLVTTNTDSNERMRTYYLHQLTGEQLLHDLSHGNLADSDTFSFVRLPNEFTHIFHILQDYHWTSARNGQGANTGRSSNMKKDRSNSNDCVTNNVSSISTSSNMFLDCDDNEIQRKDKQASMESFEKIYFNTNQSKTLSSLDISTSTQLDDFTDSPKNSLFFDPFFLGKREPNGSQSYNYLKMRSIEMGVNPTDDNLTNMLPIPPKEMHTLDENPPSITSSVDPSSNNCEAARKTDPISFGLIGLGCRPDDIAYGIQDPALCLLCGSVLQAGPLEKNSIRSAGPCTSHAKYCGGGVGIFLHISKATILLIYNDKAAFGPSIYVDRYGEQDIDLKRGLPLTLSESRLEEYKKLYITNQIPNEINRIKQRTERHIRDSYY